MIKKFLKVVFIILVFVMAITGCTIIESKSYDKLEDDILNYIDEGNFLESLEQIEEFLEKYPESDKAWRLKSDMLDKLGRIEEAVVAIGKSLELDSTILYLNIKASMLNQIGKSDEALVIYNDIIKEFSNKIDKNNPVDMDSIAAAYSEIGDYEKAIEIYESVIMMKPISDIILNNYGNVLTLVDNYEDAIKYYKRALELNMNNDLIHENLGYAYYDVSEYLNAISEFEIAFKLNSSVSNMLYEVANSYYAIGDIKNSILTYKRLIVLFPNEYYAYHYIALNYESADDYVKAVEYYEIALGKINDNPILHFDYAFSLILLGREEEGIIQLKLALALDPTIMDSILEYKIFESIIDKLTSI